MDLHWFSTGMLWMVSPGGYVFMGGYIFMDSYNIRHPRKGIRQYINYNGGRERRSGEHKHLRLHVPIHITELIKTVGN